MVSVIFTLDQLWLIRNYVRHEMQGQEQWRLPPANFPLNTKISAAILFCTDAAQSEAAVDLTLEDTYVLDFCVPDIKDANGQFLGRPILLTAYRARDELTFDPVECAEEPEDTPTAVETAAKLSEDKSWRRKRKPQPPRP